MGKDRNLTILEYFEKLQIEYFICEIRRKIYPSPVDKRYYKKVMLMKKQKIDDISQRNNLDSIFTNDEVRIDFQKRVYPDVGMPKFDLTEQDIKYYYLEDTDVRVSGEKGILGKITKADLEGYIVFVKPKGVSKDKPFPLKDVTRIL